MSDRLDQRPDPMFGPIVDHPWRVIGVFALLTVLAATQLPRTRIVTDVKAFIPRDEVYRADEDVRGSFGLRDYVIVGVVREQGIFNAATLGYVRDMAEAFGRVAAVYKVRSLFSEDNIRSPAPGEVEILPFLRDADEDSIARAIGSVRSFPGVRGTLVSPDLTCTTLLVEMDDGADKRELVHRLRAVVDAMPPPNGESIHLSGLPVFEGVLADYVLDDLVVMMPVVSLVVIALLFLAYRSVLLVVVCLVEVAVVNVWTMGLMAAVGVPLYIIQAVMPVILIALAVADEIHIFGRYFESDEGDPAPARERVLATMREMARPVVLTSVTTAAGFLSFATTSMKPLRYFGLFTAFGVMCAMAFSLAVTPAAIALCGGAKRRREPAGRVNGLLAATGRALYRGRWAARGAVLLAAIGALLAARSVYVQDSYISNFRRSSYVREASEALNRKLYGTRMMHVELDTGRPDGIKEPEFLHALSRAQERIDGIDGVGGTASLVQIIEKMNATMNAKDPRYAIPDDPRIVAYYLLLVGGRSYDSLWDDACGKARLTVFCKKGDYITSRRVVPQVEGILRQELPGVELTLGGDFVLGRRWLSLVGRDQARSLVTSLLLISVMAAIGLRSLRKALVVAAPIAFAVALKFGFLGCAGIPLSVASSTFSAIILGVGVDYAIHLQNRYDLLRQTRSRADAVAGAFGTAGEAIFWDVMVVIAGFLTLIASHMPPTQELGVMVSLGVAAAVLSTFLMLPALLGMGERGGPGGDPA